MHIFSTNPHQQESKCRSDGMDIYERINIAEATPLSSPVCFQNIMKKSPKESLPIF
jgi:hypothetical protein